MDKISAYVYKILKQKAIIHVYSIPNFMLEIFICAFICFLYMILNFEITKIGMLNKCQTNKLIYKKSIKDVCSSKDSFCTSVTHIKRELNKLSSTTTHMHIKKYTSGNCRFVSTTRNFEKTQVECSDKDDSNKIRNNVIDRFLSMSPLQYVKLEKERKTRERNLKSCLKSLTTLYSNVLENKVSQGTIKRQIQSAREELLFPQPVNKYLGFEVGALTESLFDLLEKIVTESSVDKPLPFKGDLTTLALDAGNFHMDMPFRNVKRDENEDESIISDITAYTTTLTGKSSSHAESVFDSSKVIAI